jgi:hypothetical protein
MALPVPKAMPWAMVLPIPDNIPPPLLAGCDMAAGTAAGAAATGAGAGAAGAGAGAAAGFGGAAAVVEAGRLGGAAGRRAGGAAGRRDLCGLVEKIKRRQAM